MKNKKRYSTVFTQAGAGLALVSALVIGGLKFTSYLCAFDDAAATGAEFVVMDDPQKKGENGFVAFIDGYYYIKINSQTVKIDDFFQSELKEKLKNTSREKMAEIDLPAPGTGKNKDISIDVATAAEEGVIYANRQIGKMSPGDRLTIRIMGGNDQSFAGLKTEAEYLPVRMKMYGAYYPRSNRFYVYVNTFVPVAGSLPERIASNDREYLKNAVSGYIRQAEADPAVNMKSYLIEHLAQIKREGFSGREFALVTDGEYFRADSGYDFTFQDFDRYRKDKAARLYAISLAKNLSAQGQDINIPLPLPAFESYFADELRSAAEGFGYIRIILADSGNRLNQKDFYDIKYGLFAGQGLIGDNW